MQSETPKSGLKSTILQFYATDVGISAAVVKMATIKPIDRDIIIRAAKETGCIVTAEEHNIIGGLGGAVAGQATEGPQ